MSPRSILSLIAGENRCVWFPHGSGEKCGNTFCGEGNSCVMVGGVLQCLPTKTGQHRCGIFDCEFNEYCIMVNGLLQCNANNGTAPYKCGQSTCNPPQVCVAVDGCDQCVNPPAPEKNCGKEHCNAEKELCVAVGNSLHCISKPANCGLDICTGNEICINASGIQQCVSSPSTATSTSTAAVTSTTGTGINPFNSPFSLRHSCGDQNCRANQICISLSGSLTCVSTS